MLRSDEGDLESEADSVAKLGGEHLDEPALLLVGEYFARNEDS